MIKLHIADIDVFRTEYYNLIQPLVIERLKLLKISLNHLNDPQNVDDDTIVDVKTITKNIVDSMVKPKTPKGSFNKQVYKNKVNSYRTDAKEVSEIEFESVIKLTELLLDPNSNSLETILIGGPLEIKAFHDDLFANFGIIDKLSKNVMYEAFSYDEFGSLVRDFFYRKDISNYCSYCNISKAKHTKNPATGKVVDQYHLDHFFSQFDHPMLALSLFNLVPSDYVCNSTNKGKILFSDLLHLNPYISGFSRDVVFEPLFDDLGTNIIELDLKLKCNRDSERWKQLIGDEDTRDLAPDHGNINVFQLHGKYNDENLLWQMTNLYQSFKRTARNNRSLSEFLELVDSGQKDSNNNIINWYQQLARTHFHEDDFGKLPFSKLHRDLLDHAFGVYSENLENEMIEFLVSSYLPQNGGQ